jgi:hypothetical protein
VVSGATFGAVTVNGADQPVSLLVDNTLVAYSSAGLNSDGANALIRFGRSTIIGNGNGVVQGNSGRVESYGDNKIADNTTEGSWTTVNLR